MRKTQFAILDVPKWVCSIIILTCLAVTGQARAEGPLIAPTELLLFTDISSSIASKFKQDADESPASVTVITEQQIKAMGARNLEDVFRQIPGFEMMRDVAYPAPLIAMRGMLVAEPKSDKIKYLLNGHALRSFTEGPFAGFYFLPVENIKRIEIIRGPGSALYGSSAYLGVVNIITKDGDDPSEITMQAGSYNTYMPSVDLSCKQKDLKLNLFGQYLVTDGPAVQIDSDMATVLFGKDFSAAPGIGTENQEGYVMQLRSSYSDFTLDSFFLKTIRNDMIGGATKALSGRSDTGFPMFFAELGYNKQLLDKGHFSAKAYYDYNEYDCDFELFPKETAALFSSLYPSSPYPADAGIRGLPKGKYDVKGLELNADYDVLPDIKILGGAIYEYINWWDVKSLANSNVTGVPIVIDGVTYGPFEYLPLQEIPSWNQDSTRQSLGLYAQSTIDLNDLLFQKSLGKSLELTLGVRHDGYSDTGSATLPRAGLTWALNNSLYLKSLYSTAYRAPNFCELYNKNNPAQLGNPDIHAETINSWEFVLGYDFSSHLKTSLTYFNMLAKDIIQLEGLYFKNLGLLNTQGLEGEVKLALDDKNYAFANMTWQDPKNISHDTITNGMGGSYTQKDFFPGSVPNVIANIGFNYAVWKQLNANLFLNYRGEMRRTEEKIFDLSGNLMPKDARDPLKSQVLLDASFTFENFDFAKGLQLQFTVYNLLDWKGRDPDPDGLIANDVPIPGRNYMAKLSYTF